MIKDSKFFKILRCSGFTEIGKKYEKRFDFTDNQRKKNYKKYKMSQIWQYKKTLITAFAYVLTAIAKAILEGRLCTHLCVHLSLSLFFHFLLSQDSKLFLQFWGNLFTKLVVLDIKFFFICGKSNSHGKTVNFKVKYFMLSVVNLMKSLKKQK